MPSNIKRLERLYYFFVVCVALHAHTHTVNFDRLWIGTDLEYGKKIDTAAIKLETDIKLLLSSFEEKKNLTYSRQFADYNRQL